MDAETLVPLRPKPPRRRRGKGRPYYAGVVGEARDLIQRTSLPEAAIAARVGIGVATVHGWKMRHGWTRPADVPVAPRAVGLHRAGFEPRMRAALDRLVALAERAAALSRECGDAAALSRALVLADRAARAAASPDMEQILC